MGCLFEIGHRHRAFTSNVAHCAFGHRRLRRRRLHVVDFGQSE